jgi:endonuclease-3
VTEVKKNFARARKILSILRRTYPQAATPLTHENPLQLLVAVILSAQCTDKQVNRVTPALFARYKTARDFAHSPRGELEKYIHSTGFYRNKARAIRNCCKKIAENYGGRVPDSMEELLKLDGIGRKTANVVLDAAFGKQEGVCVDTHVARLSQRLGLSRHANPLKIERDLMEIFPKKSWGDISILLIYHGRARCTARNPDCAHCEIAKWCPKIGVKNDERTQGGRQSARFS